MVTSPKMPLRSNLNCTFFGRFGRQTSAVAFVIRRQLHFKVAVTGGSPTDRAAGGAAHGLPPSGTFTHRPVRDAAGHRSSCHLPVAAQPSPDFIMASFPPDRLAPSAFMTTPTIFSKIRQRQLIWRSCWFLPIVEWHLYLWPLHKCLACHMAGMNVALKFLLLLAKDAELCHFWHLNFFPSELQPLSTPWIYFSLLKSFVSRPTDQRKGCRCIPS